MIYDFYKGISHMKVAFKESVNQDATSILITAYGDMGGEPTQFYVQRFIWAPYRGFDILDTSDVSIPGWVQIQMTGGISKRIDNPRQSFGVSQSD